jgi:hypothetical protein
MMLRIYTLTVILAATAAAQSAPPPVENWIGTIASVDGDSIVVTTGASPLTVHITADTSIWKGGWGAKREEIHTGDDISLRGVRMRSGELDAKEITLNVASLDGVITRVNGEMVDLRPIRNDKAASRRVVLNDKTESSIGRRVRQQDIQAGRNVFVVGLKREDGTILATRFVVYVNGKPADALPGAKVIYPDGTLHDQ